MTPGVLLVVYCLLVVLASFAGGRLPRHVSLSHTRLQLILSFVGGFMLGTGVLHLMPHAAVEIGSIDRVAQWTLGGMLVTFILIRIFHSDIGELDQNVAHDHHVHCTIDHSQGGRVGGVGVAFGMALHSGIDGVALAAAVRLGAEHAASGLVALGTFVAIFLHKPLDAMAVTAVMERGGWSHRAQDVATLVVALLCPLAAAAVFLGVSPGEASRGVLGLALAFAAGVFICLALSDLLPELRFHAHDRVRLSVALALGIAASVALGAMEGDHVHGAPGDDGPHHHHHH